MKRSLLNKTFILTWALALIVGFKVNAQQVQDLINQQDWITRNQQNIIEEDKRIKEKEAIKKDREVRKKEKEAIERPKIEEEKPKSSITPECFKVKKIKLLKATLLLKPEQEKILKSYEDQCLVENKFPEMTVPLEEYYKKKDPNLNHAKKNFSVKQNIENENLESQISGNKIEEIIIGNNDLSARMQEFTAFGNIAGEKLNMDDLNQGIYQINRLPSNHAILKIAPGTLKGTSKIFVENQKTSRMRAAIGYDNLGNKFTGIKRSNFSGAIDNLFSLNDALSLSYNTNLNDDNNTKNIQTFTSSFTIPYRYYTFTLDYFKSDFAGLTAGINGDTKLTGYSDRKSFTVDRLFFNQGNLRISSAASLTKKESASYLDYEKIDNSQRYLTIANFSVTITNYFKNGIDLYLKPSYSKGLKLFNAQKDSSDANSSNPQAQFDLVKLYATISKKFVMPKTNIPVTLTTEMDSQISKDTLFGSEQFSIGGYYSVRGFRENYIAGDSGYYLRNKATFNAGSLILPFLNKKNSGYLSYLNNFKIEPFYDYGHAYIRYNNSGGRLAGAGLKTIFESRYFNASLTYSVATNRSNIIVSSEKENKMIYFELSANCC